ncbi:MAG: S-layer homology domain-containing protein [Clostridiales bacterium]|jgi:hypothetical protein|nr:S-layer homology domain-containing protein [Clostridiales bacterium]
MEKNSKKNKRKVTSMAAVFLAWGITANSVLAAPTAIPTRDNDNINNITEDTTNEQDIPKYIEAKKENSENSSTNIDEISSQQTPNATEISLNETDPQNTNKNDNQIINNSEKNDLINPVSSQNYEYKYFKNFVDINDSIFKEKIKILAALEIMSGKEKGLFKPKENLTRAEAVVSCIRLKGLEKSANLFSDNNKFNDIEDCWAKKEINIAAVEKIISSDEENFRPFDPISACEAITMLVKVLGYDKAAMERGGFPEGHVGIASELKIWNDSNILSQNEKISRENFANLCYNTLPVNIMEKTSYGVERYETNNKNILSELGFKKFSGKMTATNETQLPTTKNNNENLYGDEYKTSEEKIGKNQVKINNELYYVGETNAKFLLGYNVLGFSKVDEETNDKTIVFIDTQENKNKVLNIPTDKIISIQKDEASNTAITFQNKDKNEKIILPKDETVFIYNGKTTETLTPDTLGSKGFLTFLDSDGNDNYDVVFENYFETMIVGNVSEKTGKITSKDGNYVLEENSGNNLILYKHGKEINTKDINEGDQIDLTISKDGTLIKGYVTNRQIDGSINEISNDGSLKITPTNREFKKSPKYLQNISIGEKGTFYLDAKNEIIDIETKNEPLNKNYGYLVATAEVGYLEPEVQFKIFTKNGQAIVLTSADKIKFNNFLATSPSDVIKSDLLYGDGKTKSQLITFETNSENKITEINTANLDVKPNENKFSLNEISQNLEYTAASNKLGTTRITNETIVFEIPKNALNSKDYKIKNFNMFKDGGKYDASIYDLTPDYKAGAVIITNSEPSVSSSDPFVVVDKISEIQNGDLMIVDKLYGLENGRNIEITANAKDILNKKGSKLNQGDIIRYTKNEKEEIDSIEFLFDTANKNSEYINKDLADTTLVYGRVTEVFDDSLNVSVNGKVENYLISGISIYKYDSTLLENQLKVSNINEIKDFEKDNPYHAFIRIYKDVVSGILIIK